jgi:uncharacterized protein (DUF58 family)
MSVESSAERRVESRAEGRLLAARDALVSRKGKIDWARLNHILIPMPVATHQGEKPRMLGPTARFLLGLNAMFTPDGRAFFVVVILIGVFGVDIYRTQIYVFSNVLFGLMGAALLGALLMRRTPVTATLSVPTRVSRGEPFSVELLMSHAAPRAPAVVRIGRPFLPYFARWTAPAPLVLAWSDEGKARVSCPMVFDRRGDFTLDNFAAYEVAPFGLTQRRIGRSPDLCVRVVPRPANVTSMRMELASRHQPGGVALASKLGDSMEFFGVRDYRRGDRLRDISARTWARTGKPAVREYRQEYFSRVGVFLDTDTSLYTDESFEAAIELCAGAVLHLSRGEALIDLLVAGERVQTLLLGRSLGYAEQALDFLSTVERSPPFDPDALIARVASAAEQLSSAVFVSGRFGENQEKLYSELSRRGVRVMRIIVRDEGEKSDGDGDARLCTTESIRRGGPIAL